ncbi:MAG TPA: FAD/NAD(P)-binding protein, partial [Pseudonocardiaceae bacterium]|nr:FAD/NAD(P)-binding protein [Pseudonocardiaceae bacterium]
MRTLAIIGAGPRGTGLLERIAANADLLGDARCAIHVIDPQAPGAGRVWRADQSPLLLMNSHADEVTMFTDASVRCAGPAVPGPTLAEWARTARLSDPDLATEAAELTGDSFATRRLGGQYLGWCFDRAARAIPVHVHRAAAVALHDGGRQVITLSDGERIAADLVVLAQGNVGGHSDGARLARQRFARRIHGVYLPPACAGDDDLDRLPAGEAVLVSGIGLAFIDLMALLTEGRGGRFDRDRHGRLSYRPSGREPVLHVGSRRGVPYLPKPGRQLYGERSSGPRFFTPDHIART